jgi:hypothetical protein
MSRRIITSSIWGIIGFRKSLDVTKSTTSTRTTNATPTRDTQSRHVCMAERIFGPMSVAKDLTSHSGRATLFWHGLSSDLQSHHT